MRPGTTPLAKSSPKPNYKQLATFASNITSSSFPTRYCPLSLLILHLCQSHYSQTNPKLQVYDRLPFTPFTRIATLSPAIAARTLTVGSAGKNFYCTGWRVGWLIGPANLIHYVAAAHTRICFSSVSPLQEAAAVGFEKAESLGFWEQSRKEMMGKVERFCAVFDELGLPVRDIYPFSFLFPVED